MPALEHPPLAPGDVVCWRVDLGCPDDVAAALLCVLSPDEAERAARFVFARDRRRFIVARACLRVLLASCSGTPPSEIRFAYGSHGKPALASAEPRHPVHFNVSHSEDVALIALSPDMPLGVDVEAVRPLPDLLDIASRNFTSAETEIIASAPLHERDHAFFLCWTRKEAFVKALGDGLSFPLDRCFVSCRPGEPARIVKLDGRYGAAQDWSVLDLRPAPGFVGAVVMRAPSPRLCLLPLDLDLDVLPRLRGELGRGPGRG